MYTTGYNGHQQPAYGGPTVLGTDCGQWKCLNGQPWCIPQEWLQVSNWWGKICISVEHNQSRIFCFLLKKSLLVYIKDNPPMKYSAWPNVWLTVCLLRKTQFVMYFQIYFTALPLMLITSFCLFPDKSVQDIKE